MAQQMAEIPLERANRGHARYSFGPQLHHPEWVQLIDLPAILPIVEAIWGSPDFICSGGGGDYSAPGAKEQHLHADIRDVLNDPLGQVTLHDVPTPYIVVNFLMVEFRKINGAIRFVPGTHRTRQPVPKMEEEPARMKESILCAPAGTAVIRDVRCWHGGTANDSDEIRPMTSVGYLAPWFRLPDPESVAAARALRDPVPARPGAGPLHRAAGLIPLPRVGHSSRIGQADLLLLRSRRGAPEAAGRSAVRRRVIGYPFASTQYR